MRTLSARRRLTALCAISALALLVLADHPARATVPECQQAIAKSGAKYAQARTKALAKCEIAKVTGKLPLSTVCTTEMTTAAKLTKAATKLSSAIAKACGGDDRTCDGVGDDDAEWPSACPDFESRGCTNTVGPGCGGIATCLQCVHDAAIDQAIALYAADLALPSADAIVGKCQKTIIKASQAFLISKSKALQKCWGAVMKGTATAPCPSPGNGKAAAAIQKAEDKKVAAICKACGGADKMCGGGGDLAPGAIGFVSSCPDVTKPGTGTSCGAAIADLQSLVDCVDCVTEFKVDCMDALQVPEYVSPLPAECNPPTPTPTSTPVAVCGDGIITPPEQCDEGPTTDGGCTATCQVHPGFMCTGEPSVCTCIEPALCADATPTPTPPGVDVTPTPTPTATPVAPRKRVFISSTTSTGNLGGLSGADATCQSLATAAGLSGTYLAWLSDATQSPVMRFTQATVPYKLVGGTVVANDWTDLVDGTLSAAINRSETGTLIDNADVFTNTKASGDGIATTHCQNWTSSAPADATNVGLAKTGATNSIWTVFASVRCDTANHLYCFEQ
jgi:cysteine-rich repeat protein